LPADLAAKEADNASKPSSIDASDAAVEAEAEARWRDEVERPEARRSPSPVSCGRPRSCPRGGCQPSRAPSASLSTGCRPRATATSHGTRSFRTAASSSASSRSPTLFSIRFAIASFARTASCKSRSSRPIVDACAFIDNSDVGFLSGGGTNAKYGNNVAFQLSQVAFAAVMLDNFNNGALGDHTGAIMSGNIVSCPAGGLDQRPLSVMQSAQWNENPTLSESGTT
jgi:hypothetical protein